MMTAPCKPVNDGVDRIQTICRQLCSGSVIVNTPMLTFEPHKLYVYLLHDNLELRSRVFQLLEDDLYKPKYKLSIREQRDLTMQRLRKLSSCRFFSVMDIVKDPRKYLACMECVAMCDYSMTIKGAAHFTLFGGTIARLGTRRHHEQYIPDTDSLALAGSFGMTELGHGSNVMGIETTAVYDASTEEFIIHTPRNESSKFWIGGAGEDARVCAVFAQLTVNGTWQGPHVFLVRIRDDCGHTMPGVRLRDLGAKMGLNGVDNGQIWFDNVRVPRGNMLDAFARVEADGSYHSPIANVQHRFGTMVGALTVGRISIATAAVDASKIALTIAIRYASQRPQFGSVLLLDYVTHQLRLMPALASSIALQVATADLKNVMDTVTYGSAVGAGGAASRRLHVLSSGLKALATWTRTRTLQDCRECCGGMGFLSANRIATIKVDMEPDVSFEGDNTVLMKLVAKNLVEDASGAGGGAVLAPRPPNQRLRSPPSPAHLVALMSFREQWLTAQLHELVTRPGRPASEALDAHLDLAVQLGCAAMERHALLQLRSKADAAPSPALRDVLALMAELYAVTCVSSALDVLLEAGALQPGDGAVLRQEMLRICGVLSADGGALALRICLSFGVPPHLLDAPIAANWRLVGLNDDDVR